MNSESPAVTLTQEQAMDGAGADVLIMMCRYLAGPGASNSCWLGAFCKGIHAFCKGGSKSVPSLRDSGSLYSSPQTVKASCPVPPAPKATICLRRFNNLTKDSERPQLLQGPRAPHKPGRPLRRGLLHEAQSKLPGQYAASNTTLIRHCYSDRVTLCPGSHTDGRLFI